jgi:hypothetical protein
MPGPWLIVATSATLFVAVNGIALWRVWRHRRKGSPPDPPEVSGWGTARPRDHGSGPARKSSK